VAAAAQRRFVGVVAAPAPWVFGAPAVAFAVLPTVLSGRTHGYGVVFSGLSAGLTLAVGVAVQSGARALDRAGQGLVVSAGLLATLAGMLVAVLAVHAGSIPVALAADVLLGAGYGFGLIGGLVEVQRLAHPDDLARMTAVFMALTYVGFAIPLVLAEIVSDAHGYAVALAVLAALVAGNLLAHRCSVRANRSLSSLPSQPIT